MKKNFLITIFLIILSSILIFNNLGSFAIQDWDEARHAENALEILKTNNWIVTNYGGQEDLWNLKPPLGAWLIAISFKVFGTTAFALRFWSAMSGIGIIIVLYLFGLSIAGSMSGFVSSIVALLIPIFLMNHSIRSGDYDAIITFLIVLSFYLYHLYTKSKNTKLIISTSIILGLIFMIKGVIVIIPIFIIILHSLITSTLKKKDLLYSSISFCIVTIPWIILRLINGREFFVRMINYDVLNRSTIAIEGHNSNWYYYVEIIKDNLGITLLIVALISFSYLIYLSFKRNNFAILITLWISSFLIIFTIAKTRLYWYIMPIYPAIALAIGYLFDVIHRRLKINKNLLIIIFCIMTYIPYIEIFKDTNHILINHNQQEVVFFKEYLYNTHNLYISKDMEKQQGLFFILSSYIKGNVILYNNLDDVVLNTDDSIILFNREQSDRFSLIKENGGLFLLGYKN